VQLAAAQAAAASGAPAPAIAQGSNPDLERRLGAINAQIAERKRSVQESQKAPAAMVDGGAPAVVTNELVELETEWQRLLRVLHDVKSAHGDLQQRLEHAKLSASAVEAQGGDQMQILDSAYKPLRPSQGGRTKTALMGGIMALLVAFGYAMSRVFFNDTIIDQVDIDAMQLIPVLGVVPRVRAAGAPPSSAPASSRASARTHGKEARGVV
jgi:hypothetical protein